MALEPAELQPGGTVDHYRLERTVHRGQSTVVFAATDVRTGRRVALKALGERFVEDPALRRQFVTEAQTAAQLDGHPHIVRVHGWGQYGPTTYFVTDFVDGISLSEMLARRAPGDPMAPVEVLPLVGQIADALDFAHARGVLHRDVRPANVMVRMTESARSAYLVDFGIIKDADPSRPGPRGVFLGSPDYSSPEQISGAEIDRRADVYSLACMAFEMLTGRPPYAGAPNDAARLAAHLQGPIPSARAARPDLPMATGGVFDKALAKRPDDRYASAGEFARELRAVFPLAGRDAIRPALTPIGAAPIISPLAPDAERGPRRRWPIAAAAVAAASLAVGAALVIVTGDGSPQAGGDTTDAPTAAAGATEPAETAPATTRPATTAAPTTRPTTTVAVTAPLPVTTAAATTTRPPPVGPFGFPVGATVDSASGPESSFALHVRNRTLPSDAVVPGSPAAYYAQWIRATAPDTSDPVVATATGFLVTADTPVEIASFQVDGGLVSSFRECVGTTCSDIATNVITPPECEPSVGCPHVRSAGGAVMAYQRAVITQRWPQQVVLYELVVDPDDGRAIASVEEPTGNFHYDPATRMFVATFPDRPPAGTRTELSLTLDDGSADTIAIFYGG